ncbi:hypothetical protein AMECASPLE_038200, partial [Ameca splendens]
EVDIQAALELIALRRMQDLPYENIIINGKAYSCLCDTGACRTVLTKPPPGVKYSNTAVRVRSAYGYQIWVFHINALALGSSGGTLVVIWIFTSQSLFCGEQVRQSVSQSVN